MILMNNKAKKQYIFTHVIFWDLILYLIPDMVMLIVIYLVFLTWPMSYFPAPQVYYQSLQLYIKSMRCITNIILKIKSRKRYFIQWFHYNNGILSFAMFNTRSKSNRFIDNNSKIHRLISIVIVCRSCCFFVFLISCFPSQPR